MRRKPASAGADAILGFVMPDDAAAPPDTDEGHKPHWRQADVRRAIGAAEKAGLHNYRVEIAPDGTIAIVVGMPPEDPASTS